MLATRSSEHGSGACYGNTGRFERRTRRELARGEDDEEGVGRNTSKEPDEENGSTTPWPPGVRRSLVRRRRERPPLHCYYLFCSSVFSGALLLFGAASRLPPLISDRPERPPNPAGWLTHAPRTRAVGPRTASWHMSA